MKELRRAQPFGGVQVDLVGRAQVTLAHLDFADQHLVEQGGVHGRVVHRGLGLVRPGGAVHPLQHLVL